MQPAEALVGSAGGDPLADGELAALFKPLAEARRVAVAVSGGADSLALLDCIDRWRKAPGRPDVVVLTVDHRLRPDSGSAAAAVKAIAEVRGIPARILVREGPPPESGIEAAARSARYRLLIDACRKEGVSHLAVAHHGDDVAETFLMRLKHGSGVFGLAAMRAVLPVGDVVLVRPFLGLSRARLRATTAAAGLAPIDDPMNRDPRFARTAARRLLATGDIDPVLLSGLAARFADLADAIDARASAFIAASVAVDGYAVAWLEAERFAEAPEEVRARVLVRLLIAVGGADYPPRTDRLTALQSALLGTAGSGLKRTLAGTVIERRGPRIAFYRESGRSDLPSVAVGRGYAGVWDGRFAVAVGEGAPSGLTLAALGESGRREVGATSQKLQNMPAPAGALAALPAIRHGSRIVAAPVFLDGGASVPATFRSVLGERLRTPPLFPDFTGD